MDYKRIFWTALIVLTVGIVLLFFKATALNTMVIIVGAMFLASAILNLVMQLSRTGGYDAKGRKRPSTSILGIFTAIAAGALGLWMILDPAGLTTLFIYLFGALMIIAGVFQLISLIYGFRPIKFPPMFFVLPSLLVAGGIILCVLDPETVKSSLIMITAIAMIVFAVASFIEVAGVITFRKAMDKSAAEAKAAEAEAERTVQDVTPTEEIVPHNQ